MIEVANSGSFLGRHWVGTEARLCMLLALALVNTQRRRFFMGT